MTKFQIVKYLLYFITGLFCIINLFIWYSMFTMVLAILGLFLILYAGICWKQQKNILASLPKAFQYTSRILVSTFIISFITVQSLIVVNGMRSDVVSPDYIIVLGAAIKGNQPSTVLRYRLEEAYDQYQKHPTATIICSGGRAKGDTYSEAEVMKKYLLKRNVPKQQILVEEQSTSTYENLRNSYALVNDKTATFLIVTSNFHAFRASFIAKRLGMNAYSAPSQQLFRGSGAAYLREYFAFVKVLIFD